MNTFGHNFRFTTFGESHGKALGVVIDGLPAGLSITADDIQKDLNRRRPGQSKFTSPRQEEDLVEILSGVTGGQTNGAPLALLVFNHNAKSGDYKQHFRPGHADWPYFVKYKILPQPGGGRASGRETLARVAAGAVARKLLTPLGIKIFSGTSAVGKISTEKKDFAFAETDPLRFLEAELAPQAHQAVEAAMEKGDSIGGVVLVEAENVPPGLGEPVFAKLPALLGAAFFSIGAVKAVEFGQGLLAAQSLGSEFNDPLGPDGPLENRHGGLLGGLSTGCPLVAHLYVKPTPSISLPQKTIDLAGREEIIETRGRHDPCLCPRLSVVAESMMLCVLADALMSAKAKNFNF